MRLTWRPIDMRRLSGGSVIEVESHGEHEALRLVPTQPLERPLERSVVLYPTSSPLVLDSGETLAPVRVAFTTLGHLNEAGDNAVLVCHALTGSAVASGPDGWWRDVIGSGRMLDPQRDFIVTSNVLGGCAGTTGPASVNPENGRPFGNAFPRITLADMVRVQAALLNHLGVRRLALVIGGSMGGLQVLEWLRASPEKVAAGVVVGAPARHSAWALAFNHLARLALTGGAGNDPTMGGLRLARAVATLSYRSPFSLDWVQGRSRSPVDPTRRGIETYLEHQGDRLVERFDAVSYLRIIDAMDDFDLTDAAAGDIQAPVLCVGISSDQLYPPAEVRALASLLPRGEYWELSSPHGHDAFLIEGRRLERRVKAYRRALRREGAALEGKLRQADAA